MVIDEMELFPKGRYDDATDSVHRLSASYAATASFKPTQRQQPLRYTPFDPV
jgi:hypothetical protein